MKITAQKLKEKINEVIFKYGPETPITFWEQSEALIDLEICESFLNKDLRNHKGFNCVSIPLVKRI